MTGRVEPEVAGPPLAWGHVLGIVGAVLAVSGSIFDWIVGEAATDSGFGVPIQFLWNFETTSEAGLVSVGLVVFAIALGALVTSFLPVPRVVGPVLGVAVLGVAVAYLLQLDRALGVTPAPLGLGDVSGLGPWLTAAGGALLALTWVGRAPPPSLRELRERRKPADEAGEGSDDFVASHVVPDGGMPAWAQPDPSSDPVVDLVAGVELRISEERGRWALVEASNGWQGWVDGGRLVALS